MQRLDFIKALGLGTGSILLPNPYIVSKPVKVYDNYVRGLFHHDFSKIKKSIKEGDELNLLREPENIYDSFAIQVNCDKHRLGYIAAYENIVLANMIDAGVALKTFVSRIDLNHNSYESLAIEVYAELVLPTPKLIENIALDKRADDADDLYRQNYFY